MSTTSPAATVESAPPTSRWSRLRAVPTWVIGALLVAVHLVVTFQVRPQPRWNDGIFVLNRSRDFPDVPLDHHSLRIGNILPVRALLELFGYGQVSYYAWPFLTEVLLVVAVFALGVVLFDRWTAAAATVLLIFHPVLVDTVIKVGTERMTSWQLLPDIPATAFVTAAFALIIGAAQRESQSAPADPEARSSSARSWLGRHRAKILARSSSARSSLRPRRAKILARSSSARSSLRPRRATWFVLAGFCLGWAYLVRELSVFFYPLAVGVLLAWRVPWRRWVAVAVPMLGCLVLELVLAQWAHGDPLARLKIDSEHGSAPLQPITRIDALLRFPRIVEVYPQSLVVLLTFVLMVLGALVVRRRAQLFLLTWFVVIWLPLTLVSGLLDPGFIRINASLMRYWIPVLPALVLGAAGFVAWVLGQVRSWLPEGRRPVGLAMTAAVAALGLAAAVVPMGHWIARNPRDEAWNDTRAWLHDHDQHVATIVTDDRDALVLGIYSREPVGGDLVVHAKVRKVGHGLHAAPDSTGDPRTLLLWTPTLSRHKPQRSDGWQLLHQEYQLRIYGPT